MSPVGPQLPPPPKDDGVDSQESSDDDYGPALPPSLAVARVQPTPSRPDPPQPKRRVVGPSFPPPTGAEDDDEDEDEVGPSPMLANVSEQSEGDGVKAFLESEERRRESLKGPSGPQVLKREEWMLAPPSASDLLVSLDPKKLRQSKKAFSAATATDRDHVIDNTLWTETPAERQKRLAEEASGKRKRKANAEAELSKEEVAEKRRRRETDEEMRRRLDEHTKKTRGESLVDMHAKNAKEDPEEFAGIWDHQRDMSLGGRLMSDRQRKDLIKDAGSLGDRFGSGKGGSFL